jgi:DNA-binding XRE family transcriptional regulator
MIWLNSSQMPVYAIPKKARRGPGRGRRSARWPDLNMSKAARAIGTWQSSLTRIMNGQTRPSLTMADRIAKYFGWTIEMVSQIWNDTHPTAAGVNGAVVKSTGAQEQESHGTSVKRVKGRGKKR